MRDYYPNIPKTSGIYMWYNKVNGKKYVGSAKNLFDRCGTHIRQMRAGKSCWGHLQNAYNKYGESNLLFVILLQCTTELLIKMEQYFIDKLRPEYNIRLIAQSNLGLKFSEETKEKQRKAHKNRTYPEFEASWKKPFFKGKKLPQKVRDAISLSLTGKKRSLESRMKQSATSKGLVRTCKSLNGILISPTGEIFKDIVNFREFERKHNINSRRISEFSTGKRTSWRGWKYELVSGGD